MKKLKVSSATRDKCGLITNEAIKIQNAFVELSTNFMNKYSNISPDDLCLIMLRSIIYASQGEVHRRVQGFKKYPVPIYSLKRNTHKLKNVEIT